MFDKLKSMFSKESLELAVSDVPSATSGISSKNDRLEAQRSAILAELKAMDSQLRDLSGKSAPDNYANVLKDRFCEKGLKSISSIPSEYDPFIEAVSLSINEISGIGFKEFRHFQAFKDDMAKIANQIKTIGEKLEDFKKSYYSSSEKKVNDALSISSLIKGIEADILALDSELREIEKAIPFIKENLESSERKLPETTKKIETVEMESKIRSSDMETERSIIKQKISTELGKLDNFFKKAEHDEPRKYPILAKYISNSGDAFMLDDNLEIRTVLEELKPLFRKEDPEKCEKVAEILRNIDFFDSLRQQYRGLGEKMREIREAALQETLPLEKEKNHLIMEIEEKKKEISQLLDRRTQKSKEKDRLIQQMAEKKADLQIKLQDILQREVRLT